jgi:hypothetical protein
VANETHLDRKLNRALAVDGRDAAAPAGLEADIADDDATGVAHLSASGAGGRVM